MKAYKTSIKEVFGDDPNSPFWQRIRANPEYKKCAIIHTRSQTMNERINKLFGQAMDQSIPETWTTLTHSQLSILKDKFAELIVKECIDIAQDRANFPGYPPNDVNDIIDEIREHFGVEE